MAVKPYKASEARTAANNLNNMTNSEKIEEILSVIYSAIKVRFFDDSYQLTFSLDDFRMNNKTFKDTKKADTETIFNSVVTNLINNGYNKSKTKKDIKYDENKKISSATITVSWES